MNTTAKAIQNIQEQFATIDYPGGFLDHYDQMECLASRNGLETFLVRERSSDRLCIAKCYDRSVYTGATGSDILQSLHHEGLPAFLAEFHNQSMFCVIREYVNGTPLDLYIRDHPLEQAQIIRLCIRLCDILICLHEQTPPVIHRDIKPQNIIIRNNGMPVLIDFDAARIFKSDAAADTLFLGTRAYAPPEQYGFTQTDCRADIYSFGILLRFLFTGSTQETEDCAVPAPIQKIIAKCTAFSPKERFDSAQAVQKALLAVAKHRREQRVQLLTLAITVVICLCAGFALGRYTSLFASPAIGVTFEEPLIESAVRVQLDKEEGEPITEDELKDVRALYLFGEHVAKSADALEGFPQGRKGQRGSVRSLNDLAMMPHLEELVISYQEIEDISGVSVLKHLTSVDFKHNQIADLTPLANMQLLNSVCLYETNVSDATILDTCPRLQFLELGASLVTTPMKIGGYRTLEHLSLKNMQLDTLEGMERFVRLNTLDVSGTEAPDWEALRYAPTLKTVNADETLRSQLSGALADTGITLTIEE